MQADRLHMCLSSMILNVDEYFGKSNTEFFNYFNNERLREFKRNNYNFNSP